MPTTLQIAPAQWTSLVRSCTRVTGNVHDAEDAVQDAALNVLRRLDRIDRAADLDGYLFVAARNSARQKVTRRRVCDELAETLADPGPPVDELAERRERRAQLAGALRAIPERQARAIAMVELQGASREEAAAELGLDPNALHQLMWRGRRSLARELAA